MKFDESDIVYTAGFTYVDNPEIILDSVRKQKYLFHCLMI